MQLLGGAAIGVSTRHGLGRVCRWRGEISGARLLVANIRLYRQLGMSKACSMSVAAEGTMQRLQCRERDKAKGLCPQACRLEAAARGVESQRPQEAGLIPHCRRVVARGTARPSWRPTRPTSHDERVVCAAPGAGAPTHLLFQMQSELHQWQYSRHLQVPCVSPPLSLPDTTVPPLCWQLVPACLCRLVCREVYG